MAPSRIARPRPGGESGRIRAAFRRTARRRMPSALFRDLCRLQLPAPRRTTRDRTGRSDSARPGGRVFPTGTGKWQMNGCGTIGSSPFGTTVAGAAVPWSPSRHGPFIVEPGRTSGPPFRSSIARSSSCAGSRIFSRKALEAIRFTDVLRRHVRRRCTYALVSSETRSHAVTARATRFNRSILCFVGRNGERVCLRPASELNQPHVPD